MNTNNYFFYLHIPKDHHIEYVTKLNSFIIKLFPEKPNPYVIRPMEIKDNFTISKVTINAKETEIVKFAKRFFGSDFEFVQHKNGDIEIIKKPAEEISKYTNILHLH